MSGTRERLNRRDFLRLAGLTGTVSLLAACGATPTPTPAPAATKAPAAPTSAPAAAATKPPAAQPTAAPAAAGAPKGGPGKYGGTLIIAMGYEPKVWNVNYDFDGGAPYLNMNVYSKLVNYDYVSNEIHADLAEKWDVASDAKKYTFYLRKGVTWHDGKPFSAADVKWTMEDILKQGDKSVTYKMISDIDTIQTPDDYTVVCNLKTANAVFLANVASYYGFNILPKHRYEGTDVRANPDNVKPVGTGPYRLVEHVVGSHATMDANRDYWGPGPYTDKLIFRFIPNLATAISALEAGEVSYSAASPAFGDVKRLQSLPGLRVDPSISSIVQWFGFNFERKEYQDVRVRKAVAMAINRQEIVDKLYQGFVKPAEGYYTSVVSWANNPNAKQPAYDPAGAEKLLDEAGYKKGSDGIRFKTRYVAFTASIWGGPEIAQMIKQYLAKVGIDVTVEVLEFALFNEKIRNKRDFDLVHSGGPRGPDPSEFLNFVGSKGTRNVMPWINTDVDKLFDQAKATADQKQRAQFYYQIQDLVARDCPMVNIVEYSYMRPSRSDYSGFWWQQEAVGRLGQDMYNGVQWAKGTQKP